MQDRRHLAHRADSQVLGPARVTGFQVEQVQLVDGGELFQQDDSRDRALIEAVKESDVTVGRCYGQSAE